MKGVFLDLDTVSHQGDIKLRPLEKVLSVLKACGTTPPEKILDHVAGSEVVITNKVRLDAETIKRMSGVRLICLAATGVNNVDMPAAFEKGIGVCNVPAYSTQAVAQHVFALLLSLTQHLDGYQALLREGAWKRAPQFTLLDYPIRELAGKRLGILGYGDIGKAVAKIAEAFGMTVLLAARDKADKRAGRVPLENLLPVVDALSIHLPLTKETRGMLGAKELILMQPNAILINTARGPIVDERALAALLKAGRLGGAGIDVLSEEPPVNGNPLLEPGIPNLIVTPHIAWASKEARQRVIQEVALNIAAFQQGELRNRKA